MQFDKEFTGVLDRINFGNIKIYAGRGVGGRFGHTDHPNSVDANQEND